MIANKETTLEDQMNQLPINQIQYQMSKNNIRMIRTPKKGIS